MSEFGQTVTNDLFGMLLGEFIGAGACRQVYVYEPNSDYVIKIEDEGGSFQNVMEWETWLRVEHTAQAPWFAPCMQISPAGTILIQRRTQPLGPRDLPERVPNFFTDMKAENFGWLDGQVACHDYGLHLLMEVGLSRRLCKARWG